MKKVKTFENENRKIYMSGCNDVKCTIKKEYLSHWLFKDVPLEFVVENKNNWEVHPINIPSGFINQVQKNY